MLKLFEFVLGLNVQHFNVTNGLYCTSLTCLILIHVMLRTHPVLVFAVSIVLVLVFSVIIVPVLSI